MNGIQKTPGETLNYDVVVAGGGTAGCAAAIAAARRGHRVLVIEAGNSLGGVSTSGGVNEWYAHLDGLGNIFDRVTREMDAFGAKFGRFFNGEYLKIVWQMLVREAGVDVLFHANLCGADAEEGRVTAVQALCCGQVVEARAPYFIDTSGEGTLGFLAGADYMKGDPAQGRTLHMSLTCMLFDTGKEVTPYLPPELEPINNQSELPGLHASLHLPDGRVYCNMSKVMGEDATHPLSLSRAEQEARLQVVRIVHFLQRTSYPRHMLGSTGARIGIREGRRLLGDYVVSESDITSAQNTDFPDGVAVATCAIDFHSLTKAGNEGWRQRVSPYALPLRAMTSKGFANLLMAGKCISGDQVAHSSYRMTPTCCMMGQAVGTAAAMAMEANAPDIRQVDITNLRAQLTTDGMQLNPSHHEAFAPGHQENSSAGRA